MENNNEMNTELDTTATEMESTESQTMEADAEGEQLEAEADKTPAWVEFCGALTAHATALGLAVQDQKSFTKFAWLSPPEENVSFPSVQRMCADVPWIFSSA